MVMGGGDGDGKGVGEGMEEFEGVGDELGRNRVGGE